MTDVLQLNVLLLRVDGEMELLVGGLEESLSRVESSGEVEEEYTASIEVSAVKLAKRRRSSPFGVSLEVVMEDRIGGRDIDTSDPVTITHQSRGMGPTTRERTGDTKR